MARPKGHVDVAYLEAAVKAALPFKQRSHQLIRLLPQQKAVPASIPARKCTCRDDSGDKAGGLDRRVGYRLGDLIHGYTRAGDRQTSLGLEGH